MGKASKRKQKSFAGEGIKQPIFDEGNSSSFLLKYAFFITLLLITITTVIIYSNIFSSPFHFDDTTSIVENYQIRDLKNFWPPSGSRYIGVLSFALDYHFGGLDVFGYHLVNIIIHIINGLLVWWLVVLTFKTPAMERIEKNPQLRYVIALVASLIFVVHPIQTQAVTYIVQRFASLAALFYILSLAIYIKARIMQETENRKEEREKRQFYFIISNFYFLTSVLSAILAMKTKEISFTLPFVVILYEFMFFNPLPVIETGAKQSQGQHFAKRLIYLIPFALTLFIIPLSFTGTDKPIGDMIGELREAAQETESIPRGVYLLTQFRVIVTYIRLLFLPINQNLDYDYPLSQSLFEPQIFLSFLFLSAIFVFAVYLYIRSRRSPSPLAPDRFNRGLAGEGRGEGKCYTLLASFGILWFFITLSVESSIIPIRDVIFEHRLYLPSVGAMIAFGSGIFYLIERWKIKNILLTTCVLLLVTVVPLGVATYKRNLVWKDEITLWEDVIEKNPEKARGHNNLGSFYSEQKQLDKAINEYLVAIKLKPDFADAHNNLGTAYEKRNLISASIEEYKIAIKFKPDHPKAHYNLGVVYHKQGHIDEAIEEYKIALTHKPSYSEAHYNLGTAYGEKGLFDKSINELMVALHFRPDYLEAHYNLGVIYHKQGRIDKAIGEYKMALTLKPDYPEAHSNLGAIYYAQGLQDEAIKEYIIALRLKPDFPEAHYNLGLAYKAKGMKNEQ